MNFFFSTTLLFIGLLLPVLIGLPFTQFTGITLNRIERFILSFLFGWLIFFAIFAIAGFLGFGFSFMGGLTIILILSGMLFYLFRKKRVSIAGEGNRELKKGSSKADSMITFLLILMSVVMFTVLFIESVGDTGSMPMQAVWGYKAKLFFLEGKIPLSFFYDPDIPFTHQSYPLLFPIMLTWSYLCMGGVYEPLIKLMPPCVGVLIFLSLYGILRREGLSRIVSLIVSILFCGGTAFSLCSTIIYAENILILYELWGVYFLYLYLRGFGETIQGGVWRSSLLLFCGFIFLAGGACVKNEGFIYFALATLYIFMILLCRYFKHVFNDYRGKSDDIYGDARKSTYPYFAAVLLSAALFIVPWMLFRYYLNVPVRDFSIMEKLRIMKNTGFIESGSLGILKLSCGKFLYTMFVDLQASCGVWYFLIILFFVMRKKLFQKHLLFLICMIFLPIAIFAVSFIFSLRPIGWHMDAIPRLLLVPELFALIFILCTASLSRNSLPRSL